MRLPNQLRKGGHKLVPTRYQGAEWSGTRIWWENPILSTGSPSFSLQQHHTLGHIPFSETPRWHKLHPMAISAYSGELYLSIGCNSNSKPLGSFGEYQVLDICSCMMHISLRLWMYPTFLIYIYSCTYVSHIPQLHVINDMLSILYPHYIHFIGMLFTYYIQIISTYHWTYLYLWYFFVRYWSCPMYVCMYIHIYTHTYIYT